MKYLKKIVWILTVLLLFLASCQKEQMDMPSKVAHLVLESAPVTRAHWTDNGDGTGLFHWDDSSDMLLTVSHDSSMVPLYSGTEDPAPTYYSMASVQRNAQDDTKARIRSLKGVKTTYESGQAVLPVEIGDSVFMVSPVNLVNGAEVLASSGSLSVTLPVPDTLSQSASGELAMLRDYAYVCLDTQLDQVSPSGLTAQTGQFKAVAALLRFNVTSLMDTAPVMTSIETSLRETAMGFPDHLIWKAENASSVQEPADKSAYYRNLTLLVDDGAGQVLEKDATQTYYMPVLPLDSTRSYQDAILSLTVRTSLQDYELRLQAGRIPDARFQAGRIYTFNILLDEYGPELSTLEVAECMNYDVTTEQVSQVILTSDAVWGQTTDVAASMEFIGLGLSYTEHSDGVDKTYDVLWATTNLGAKEAVETGRLYAWGESLVKADAQYSPSGYLSEAYQDLSGTQLDPVRRTLGNGHWKWVMPTRQMWEDLLNECDWQWTTVKKVQDGSSEEENLDFDASVWNVSRRDAEGNLIGSILLPITGYLGEKTDEPGSYGRNNLARCCYWTSTPVGETAGATQQSYAFYTRYIVDGDTGSMTQPVLMTQDRYQGFAIRPVLLKERMNP